MLEKRNGTQSAAKNRKWDKNILVGFHSWSGLFIAEAVLSLHRQSKCSKKKCPQAAPSFIKCASLGWKMGISWRESCCIENPGVCKSFFVQNSYTDLNYCTRQYVGYALIVATWIPQGQGKCFCLCFASCCVFSWYFRSLWRLFQPIVFRASLLKSSESSVCTCHMWEEHLVLLSKYFCSSIPH